MKPTFNIVVAGSRSFNNYTLLCEVLDRIIGHEHVTIISGHASSGADVLGERYATEHGHDLVLVPAEWSKYGRGAGPKRNKAMATQCDVLVAFWDGKSAGTKSMINEARKLNRVVHVINYGQAD